MNAMELYQVTDELKAIIANTEDEAPIDMAAIENLSMDFKEIAVNLIAYSKNLKASIDTIEDQIQYLKTQQTVFENRKKSVTKHLLTNMQQLNLKRIDHPLHRATISKSKTKIVIHNEDIVPEQWLRITVKTEVDKTKILKHIQADNPTPNGVEAVEGVHLRIPSSQRNNT